MSALLWDKGGAAVDARLMRFLAGQDVVLDRQLFLYDIRASAAHARGLARIGVLSEAELAGLVEALETLAEDFAEGRFVLDARFEDGHSAIEARLIERLGDVGKKIHTGRSRNDQILVAGRLFLKDALRQAERYCLEAARACLTRAEAGASTPMPGYTHLQRAVPSSLGMYFAGFAEAFIDDAALMRQTHDWIDASPLGTAAGYGVNLPLDRQGVAEELGFARLQINPIYAQNSRGRFELQALYAMTQAMGTLRRLAWDLSLFTTAEFAFARLGDAYTTGSSIMPNKRNPDVVELLRAAYAPVAAAASEVQQILSLPSGYQRDLQGTKPPTLRGIGVALEALGLVEGLLDAVTFDEARLREAISPEMYATDEAVALTAEGVPFREAYRRVGATLDALADRAAEVSLQARVSPGACADLMLSALAARIPLKDPGAEPPKEAQ
ncbi:argininosuccinate lyase [Myxococcota bacterium]|nr:argininosuccinate lyase [Myxococcota bacterium]MBU1431833.1 argininosuccinate lyase [Myxococcota bacterium]MBU1897949.1 argininosuccinate lyase [Myxococcota bacterium]